MKYIQAFASAVVLAVLVTFSASASAQTEKPGFATIVRIQGQARYSSDGNTWLPLVVGKVLGAGDVIQSGVDSTVDIVLGDGAAQIPVQPTVKLASDAAVRGMTSFKASTEQNVIRLQADTVLAIDKLTVSQTGVDAVSDTELDLRQGKIFGNVKKISAASQYLIKTPTGVAGVRGTTFLLGADGDVTVISGSVVVAHVNANGQTVTAVLGSGDSFNPQTGLVTNLRTGVVTNPQTGQTVGQVPRAELRRDIRQLLDETVYIVTIIQGTISFPNDQTFIYVSPTAGRR